MGFHRPHSYVELPGNQLVAAAMRQQQQHFMLAPGELRRIGLGLRREVGKLPPVISAAAANDADGSQDIFGRRLFQHVTTRACTHGAQHVFAVVVHAEHQHADRRVTRAQRSGQFDAVHAAHTDVDQHQVRRIGLRKFERLGAAGRLADDFQVRHHRQAGTQPVAYQRMIVDDDQPDQGKRVVHEQIEEGKRAA